ncbi:B-cell receptor CD22-like [Alosa sapidissima]|uniref:B-cell receptor CD22-like n=1 Tax=Alosa sapidissima TaxID=34773 RepID=UPI001C091AD4|nr:B-cell receptor CD22-like [Alosa sapidissima]
MIGSSVVMPCSFTHPGLRIYEVYWVKKETQNGTSLDLLQTPLYEGRVHYSTEMDRNCTLTLRDVRVTDAGHYYVTVITYPPRRRWLSTFVMLVVTDTAALQVRPSGSMIEGQLVKLSCESLCILRQKSSIRWRRNGEIIPFNQTINNELILHNIQMKDEGLYTCALEQQEDLPSLPLKLNVMYAPKNTSVFVYPSGEMLEGTSVTLSCSSDANPPVENYTWYRQTRDKTTEVGSAETITFTLNTTTAGLYHCEAKNRIASQNSPVVDVSLAVYGWQRAALYVLGGIVTAVTPVLITFGLGLTIWRRKKIMFTFDSGNTDNVTQDYVDYVNDPLEGNSGAIQMSSLYQSLNPNTTQPPTVYQSLNPNTTQPDAIDQSLSPNTTHPVAFYQSLNPNTTQPDTIYQSLNL